MFDLLPNNQANQSQAKTPYRKSCTGTDGSEEKRRSREEAWGETEERIRRKKGAVKSREDTERSEISSTEDVEIAHLYYGVFY